MKKTIELNYGTSITINRGSYENEKPMWHQKVTFELNGETPEAIEALENAEFNRLKTKLDAFAQEAFRKSKIDLSSLRIRIKDGKQYVSVTSILTPDAPPIEPEYGLRGAEIHRLLNAWIKTGVWEEPAVPLKKLSYADIPYREFCEKFKDKIAFKDAELNLEVFHEKHLYSGEIDIICPVEGILTLADFKTGGYDFKQPVAYYKALPANLMREVKQLAFFDLKNREIKILKLSELKCIGHWEGFLIKRGVIKARFEV